MKLYQKIIAGGLVIAGLAGLPGCDNKPALPIANTNNKNAVLQIPVGGYWARAMGAGDIDGDGLADILSTDKNGNVYVHKNLGNGQYVKLEKPVFRIPVGGYWARAMGCGDMNGDGLADILSTDKNGNVYIYKNLGNLKFQK